jgi:hypothetical protein
MPLLILVHSMGTRGVPVNFLSDMKSRSYECCRLKLHDKEFNYSTMITLNVFWKEITVTGDYCHRYGYVRGFSSNYWILMTFSVEKVSRFAAYWKRNVKGMIRKTVGRPSMYVWFVTFYCHDLNQKRQWIFDCHFNENSRLWNSNQKIFKFRITDRMDWSRSVLVTSHHGVGAHIAYVTDFSLLPQPLLLLLLIIIIII